VHWLRESLNRSSAKLSGIGASSIRQFGLDCVGRIVGRLCAPFCCFLYMEAQCRLCRAWTLSGYSDQPRSCMIAAGTDASNDNREWLWVCCGFDPDSKTGTRSQTAA